MRPLVAPSAVICALTLSQPVTGAGQTAGSAAPGDGQRAVAHTLATVSAQRPAVLSITMGPVYPAPLVGWFLAGNLTWDGCSPLYLPGEASRGCPLLRGEPAWVDVTIRWWGSKPLTLYPLHSDLLNVRVRRGADSVPAPRFATTLRPGSAVTRSSDGAFPLSGPGGLALRVDFSAATETLEAGDYSACVSPALVPEPEVPWSSNEECFLFTMYEIDGVPFCEPPTTRR